MDYDRGDIVLVDFNPAKGDEIRKLRSAVIMSQKMEIEALETVVVIPLSTVIEPETKPYRVFVSKREALQKDSDVCVYEIRALSKKRLKKKIATLKSYELKMIQKSLCELFG